jgi:hypothetical protein
MSALIRWWRRWREAPRSCAHVGKANGVVLFPGCEWCVRRWVRDGDAVFLTGAG